MFAPNDGVAMGIAKEEGRLGTAAIVEGRHGGHLTTDDSECRRFGGIGHPTHFNDGATAISRERDVGGLPFALATAVVTSDQKEIAGSVVGFSRSIDRRMRKDEGRITARAPLDRALFGLVERFARGCRATAGVLGTELVRITQKCDTSWLSLGFRHEGAEQILARRWRCGTLH